MLPGVLPGVSERLLQAGKAEGPRRLVPICDDQLGSELIRHEHEPVPRGPWADWGFPYSSAGISTFHCHHTLAFRDPALKRGVYDSA